jgi:putative membrane protein
VLIGPRAARRRDLLGRRSLCFFGGWLIATLALVSPLCPLTVSLFSARVSEHMLLATVAAPLIAIGRPGQRASAFIRHLTGWTEAKRTARPRTLLAASAFTVALWFWHAPVPYTATFESDFAYWTMQVTLFGTALWFWSALLDDSNDNLAEFVGATFLITGQMGLLGAIITFAGHPLYPPHQLTTAVWGLTPLEDQQLGGVVMWIPAGAIFTSALVFAFVRVMRRAETRNAARFATQRG